MKFRIQVCVLLFLFWGFSGIVNGASLEVLQDKVVLKDTNRIEDAQGNYITIPPGGVILWSGSISAIPNGWALCDGSNGTPDLTDRFVIHADADSGGTNNVGDIGDGVGATGGTALTLSQIPSHTHSFSGQGDTNKVSGSIRHSVGDGVVTGHSTSTKATTEKTKATGSGNSHNHSIQDYKPKFFALAYIMKL